MCFFLWPMWTELTTEIPDLKPNLNIFNLIEKTTTKQMNIFDLISLKNV